MDIQQFSHLFALTLEQTFSFLSLVRCSIVSSASSHASLKRRLLSRVRYPLGWVNQYYCRQTSNFTKFMLLQLRICGLPAQESFAMNVKTIFPHSKVVLSVNTHCFTTCIMMWRVVCLLPYECP